MAISLVLRQKSSEDLEPRWFIWTIVLLLVIGFSLSGFIMVSQEQQDAQVYESPVVEHVQRSNK